MTGPDRAPQLSVVIPTYRGDDWVCDCLDSLAAQTLPWERFEVLLVQNGPVTRTAEKVASWLAEHPGFQLTLLRSERYGVSAARNLGLDAARADYVTFVDDDDRAAPGMLAALAGVAAPDVIGSVLMGGVTDGDYSQVSFDNYYSRALRPFQGRTARPTQLPDMLSPTCAKVVATDLAREVRFDETIFKGQDTVFWVSVAARRKLRQVVVGDGAEAAYLYNKRSGSLRQVDAKPTWEHNVEARVKMVRALAAIPIGDPEIGAVRDALYRAVFRTDIRPYLREYPGERARVLTALRDGGVSSIPWKHLNLDLAREFAVVDLLGASPTEVAARLLRRGTVVDVLTYATSERASALGDAEPVIDNHVPVAGPATVSWDLVARLAQGAGEIVDRVEAARKVPYATLYSSSAGPLGHVVAAALKLKRPDWPWTAEDARADGPGANAPLGKDPLARQLCAMLAERGVETASLTSIGELARALVATFANEPAGRDETARENERAVEHEPIGAAAPTGQAAPSEPPAPPADDVELVFLGVDERAAAELAGRGRAADVVALPLPGQDVAAELAAVEAVAREVSAIVVPELSWQAAELLLGPLQGTLASIRDGRAPLTAVRSLSASPLDHLAAALVRLTTSDVRWTAELLAPAGGNVAGDDDGAGAPMRTAILDAVGAAGHPRDGAPTGLAAFAAWVARLVSDEVIEHAAAEPGPAARATQASVTQAPVTQAPVTQDPVTQEPAMQEPAMQVPATRVPDAAETPEPSAPPRISVILPTYRGDDWIAACLDSLAAQSLPWDDFEVVVVANGPRTRTPQLVEDWLAAHPGFRLRLIVTDEAGASRARNLGLDAAQGEYAAFVDDDDLVAPRMLEVLLAEARPGVVPMAAMGLFADDPAAADFENWYTRPLLPHLPMGADNARLYPTLTGPWAKLVPVELARRVRFREDLRLGEDRVFWMDVFAAERLQLVFSAWSADAAYLYRQRPDSLMGRGEQKSWEGFALPWLDAASALLDIDAQRGETAELVRIAHDYMFGNFLRSYVAAHPEDAGRCGRLLAERGLASPRVPWRRMFAKAARGVAFVGATPQRDDDGAVGQRVAAAATYAVDAVAYDAGSGGDGALEECLGTGGVPLDNVITAAGPARLTWSDFGALATRVGAELEKHEATKPGGYLAAHSVSASPVDHLLAALFKLARPTAAWTAEPLRPQRRQQVAGAGTIVEGDRWFQVLGAGLVEAGFPVEEVPEQLELFAELVTLGLADTIVFDSAEHADEVLGRCPVPEVAARARARMTLAGDRERAGDRAQDGREQDDREQVVA